MELLQLQGENRQSKALSQVPQNLIITEVYQITNDVTPEHPSRVSSECCLTLLLETLVSGASVVQSHPLNPGRTCLRNCRQFARLNNFTASGHVSSVL